MLQRLYRSYQALLLLALCIYLAVKAASAQLTFYINLRFVPPTIFAAIFLAIPAQTLFTEIRRARQRAEGHHLDDHDDKPDFANLWFMLIPLVIAILIPTRAVNAAP